MEICLLPSNFSLANTIKWVEGHYKYKDHSYNQQDRVIQDSCTFACPAAALFTCAATALRRAAPDCNRVCSTDSHNRRWPCARVHLATSRAVVTTSGSNLLVVVVRSAFQRDGNVYTSSPPPPLRTARRVVS